MTSTFVKTLSASTMFVLMASVVASNAPAFAINGHGVSYGPQFGAGPYLTYNDGLKINGKPIDISQHSQTIETQKIYVNDPSEIMLKIYHHDYPQAVQHVIVYLNLKDKNPQPSQSDTWIEYDKTNGVSIHDPNKVFKSVTAKATYDTQFMYLSFKLVAQKSIDTTHVIIRAWDYKLSTTEVDIFNAIKIGYLPKGFSHRS